MYNASSSSSVSSDEMPDTHVPQVCGAMLTSMPYSVKLLLLPVCLRKGACSCMCVMCFEHEAFDYLRGAGLLAAWSVQEGRPFSNGKKEIKIKS